MFDDEFSFGELVPTFQNRPPDDRVLEYDINLLGVRETVGCLAPTYADTKISLKDLGVDFLGPTMPDIDKFSSNKKGVSKKSSQEYFLNHNADTCALSNPVKGSKAVFIVTRTKTKYKKMATGGKGDRVGSPQTRVATVLLETGKDPVTTDIDRMSKNVTVLDDGILIVNYEGWTDEPGWFKDRYTDSDIIVEFRKYKPPATEDDPDPDWIYSTGAGGTNGNGNGDGPPDWLPWAIGGVLVVGGLAAAAHYFTKRPQRAAPTASPIPGTV